MVLVPQSVPGLPEKPRSGARSVGTEMSSGQPTSNPFGKLSQVCVIFVALKAGMCRIKTIVRSARLSGEIRLAESRVIGWDDACGDVVGCRPANPVVSGELGQSGAVDEPAQDQH